MILGRKGLFHIGVDIVGVQKKIALNSPVSNPRGARFCPGLSRDLLATHRGRLLDPGRLTWLKPTKNGFMDGSDDFPVEFLFGEFFFWFHANFRFHVNFRGCIG